MRKRGFTLIELLAVILILGIIALIAIPTINNIVKESKKGAFKSSAQNIVSSIEQKCRVEQLKGDAITKYYRFEDGVQLTDAGFKGEIPTDGSVVVDDECNIDVVINKENYIAVKSKEEDEVTIIEDKYYVPGTPVVYNPGDNNYTDWYVLKDHGDSLTLILSKNLNNSSCAWATYEDYNINGETMDNYQINSTKNGPLTAINKLNQLTNLWSNEAKENIRLLKLSDVFQILGVNNIEINSQLFFDTKTNNPLSEIPEGYVSKYNWLSDNLSDSLESEEPHSYWMNDKIDNSNYVYYIQLSKVVKTTQIFFFQSSASSIISQIRPVITIPKSSLINN